MSELSVYVHENAPARFRDIRFREWPVRGHTLLFQREFSSSRRGLLLLAVNSSRRNGHTSLSISPLISLRCAEVEEAVLSLIVTKRSTPAQIEFLRYISRFFTVQLKYATPQPPDPCKVYSSKEDIDGFLRETCQDMTGYGLEFLERCSDLSVLFEYHQSRKIPSGASLIFGLLTEPFIAWFNDRSDVASEILERNFFTVDRDGVLEFLPGRPKRWQFGEKCRELFKGSPRQFDGSSFDYR